MVNFDKVYGAYDLKNRWNAAIDINNKTYRYRVEVLVLKGDKVFLSVDKNNEFIIPGGSGEKNIPDNIQVVNECKEEARINVRDVIYTGINRIQGLPPHIGKHKSILPFKYVGSFSKIYVAQYDSVYNGHVDERDVDEKIARGKFYPIKEVINKLKPEWQSAISQYGYHSIIEDCKDLKAVSQFTYEVAKLAKINRNTANRPDATYYRVTYSNIGIYEALKEKISASEWKNILKTDSMRWLPKPNVYGEHDRSYFTKDGFDMFLKKTYPVIKKYLDPKLIKIDKYNVDMKPIYRDKYQIVVDESISK